MQAACPAARHRKGWKMQAFPDDSGKTRIFKAADMDRVYSILYEIRELK